MAVDLFPQTMHCEMLLLLERVDYSCQGDGDVTASTVPEEEETQPTAS